MKLGRPSTSTAGVGLRRAPACAKDGVPRPVTVPQQRNWVPTSSCLVSQPPRLLTIPEPHRGLLVGGRYRCACVCCPRVLRGGGGEGRWGGVGGVQGHREGRGMPGHTSGRRLALVPLNVESSRVGLTH